MASRTRIGDSATRVHHGILILGLRGLVRSENPADPPIAAGNTRDHHIIHNQRRHRGTVTLRFVRHHHFPDKALAAAELHRVLRPGGHAAIWTATPEHVQTFPLNAWFPSFRAIDAARFPPPERWMSLLARAGFPRVAAEQFRVRRSPTLAWLAGAVGERYLSTFDHISEAEYRVGLRRLEREAAAAPGRRVDYSMEWSLIWARRY